MSTIYCSLLQTKSHVRGAAQWAAVFQPNNAEMTINSTQQHEAPGAAAGGAGDANIIKAWTTDFGLQPIKPPKHQRHKRQSIRRKRMQMFDEAASEAEDKRSGSLEESAKAQLCRMINGSVVENRSPAGCDTAANCRCFKSSFDSFVMFSSFSGRMERRTNRCLLHVGALFFVCRSLYWEIQPGTSSWGLLDVLEKGLDWKLPTFIRKKSGDGIAGENNWCSHSQKYEYAWWSVRLLIAVN